MNKKVVKKAFIPYLILNVLALILWGIILHFAKTDIAVILSLVVFFLLNYSMVANTIKLAIANNEPIMQPIEMCKVTFDSVLKREISEIVTNCKEFGIDNGIEQCAYRLKGLTMSLESGINVRDITIWKKEVTAFKMEMNGILDVMNDNAKYADYRETLQRIDNVLERIESCLHI